MSDSGVVNRLSRDGHSPITESLMYDLGIVERGGGGNRRALGEFSDFVVTV